MKKITLIVSLLIFAASITFAQEVTPKKEKKEKKEAKVKTSPNDEIKTIFGPGKISHGGFIAFSGDYSNNMLDRNALLLGARGGWIMDHWFSIGMGGYGLVTPISKDYFDNNNELRTEYFNMGYGGLYLELSPMAKFPVHFSFPILLGAGGCGYYEKIYNTTYEWEDYSLLDSDAFFIVEPGVQLEINVLKNLRLGFGANYRYVEDLDIENTAPDALNGMSYDFTIKLGKF